MHPNGETSVEIPSLRAIHTGIIVQTALPPIDTAVRELFQIVCEVRQAGTRNIIAVLPCIPYRRQDHDTPSALQWFMQSLAGAGVYAMVTVDAHNAKCTRELAAQVGMQCINIPAQSIFGPLWNNADVLLAPDTGSAMRLRHRPVATLNKQRIGERVVLSGNIDVRNKRVCVIDDESSTGATLEAAVHVAYSSGASSITAAITHATFTLQAYTRIQNTPLQHLYTTDTLPMNTLLPFAGTSYHTRIVSVIPAVAHQLQSVFSHEFTID